MAIATKLSTIQKRVLKKYPHAYVKQIAKDKYTICMEQEDLSIYDILAEMYMPYASSPETAWSLASQSVRIEQNINRTHPLRIEGMNMEDKLHRMEIRKMKNKKELPKKGKKSKNNSLYL